MEFIKEHFFEILVTFILIAIMAIAFIALIETQHQYEELGCKDYALEKLDNVPAGCLQYFTERRSGARVY